MTLKTTFAIGLAVAALVSVQAASAQQDVSDRAQQDPIAYSDAHQRALSGDNGTNSAPPAGHIDRYEVDLPSGPASLEATGTGTEIEWPQLGIGFGVGMVFLLGLILVVRFGRGRPLAHG
jgi:hypothetical protein